MATRTPGRLRLRSTLPRVPTDRSSRITLAWFDQDGDPIFHPDPVTGHPATLVLLWPVDSRGQIRPEALDGIMVARWDLDPEAWSTLERLAGLGWDLTSSDIRIRAMATETHVDPTVRTALALVDRADLAPLIDRGIHRLRQELGIVPQPGENRENAG